MKTTLLIDGDVIAYRAAASTMKVVEWQPGVPSYFGDNSMAEVIARDEIEGAFVNLEADEVLIALSDPEDNFRTDVLPSYKGHRAAIMKPVGLAPLRDALRKAYPTIEKPRLEADDVLGIIATSGDDIVTGRKIIVTRDKDLRTIPAEVYFLGARSGKYRWRTVTQEQADKFWLLQTLMGDTTDGYKGCPGIGDVKAARLLEAAGTTFPEWWDCVVSAYEAAGQTKEDAIRMAQVARILRSEDYNWKTEEVNLWVPSRTDAPGIGPSGDQHASTAGKPSERRKGRQPKSKKLVRHLKGIRAMTRLRTRVFGRM